MGSTGTGLPKPERRCSSGNERLKNRSPLQNKRYLIPVVYVLLLTVGFPWYLPPDLTVLVFGFPLWVFISLLVAFIGAGFTAWLYLVEFTEDDP